jgi:hypothetical protein
MYISSVDSTSPPPPPTPARAKETRTTANRRGKSEVAPVAALKQ